MRLLSLKLTLLTVYVPKLSADSSSIFVTSWDRHDCSKPCVWSNWELLGVIAGVKVWLLTIVVSTTTEMSLLKSWKMMEVLQSSL